MEIIWNEIIIRNYPYTYTKFINGVKNICQELNINNINWLIHIFYIESGINHKAVNKYTNAYGLIQFMPFTINKQFNMELSDFRLLDEIQQLEYVKRYLMPYKKYYNKFINIYLAVFFPLAIGKPDSFVLESKNLKAETIARLNKIYDLNNDNKITIEEINKKIIQKVPERFKSEFV